MCLMYDLSIDPLSDPASASCALSSLNDQNQAQSADTEVLGTNSRECQPNSSNSVLDSSE